MPAVNSPLCKQLLSTGTDYINQCEGIIPQSCAYWWRRSCGVKAINTIQSTYRCTCSNCCFGVKFSFGFEWGKQCGAMRIETCDSIQSAYWLAEPWPSLRKVPMLKFNNDSFHCSFYTITSIRAMKLMASLIKVHWTLVKLCTVFYCCCNGPFSSALIVKNHSGYARQCIGLQNLHWMTM